VLRRAERRLGRAFQLVLLAAAAPAALVMCSPKDSPPVDDASAGTDAAVDAATPSDAPWAGVDHFIPGFPDSGTADAYIAWCDAGPPVSADADPCNYYVQVPCGLPEATQVLTANGDLTRCDVVCILDAGAVQGCELLVPFDGAPYDYEARAPALVACTLCQPGRAPAGLRRARAPRGAPVAAYLARAAHMEAASVHAFRVMERELAALAAPRALTRAAKRAAADEVRHARVTARLARARGSKPPPVRVARAVAGPRSAESIALENAVEGCVRETWSALVACWQAEHARDETVARAMRRIAADETRHAALSWEVARFLDARLDAAARARVAAARARAIAELERAAAASPHVELVRDLGLPGADASRALARGMRVHVWR
jgi:hypothetical protein